MLRIRSSFFALLLLVVAVPAAAQDEAADLEGMTSFLFPSEVLVTLINDSCDTRRRTHLMENSGVVDADRQIPGLIDHMVAATRDHCREHTADVVAQFRARVSAEWSARVSPEENSRLAEVFRPEIIQLESRRVQVLDALALDEAFDFSAFDISEADRQDFAERQAAFSASPGGGELLQRLWSMQTEIQQREDEYLLPIKNLVQDALAVSREAANDYVVERGFGPLYPD